MIAKIKLGKKSGVFGCCMAEYTREGGREGGGGEGGGEGVSEGARERGSEREEMVEFFTLIIAKIVKISHLKICIIVIQYYT